MTSAFRLVISLLAAVLLCQCGAPQPPRCARVPTSSRAPSETLISRARTAWNVLASPSRRADWPAARLAYNDATTKLFDQLHCGKGTWSERATRISTGIAASDPHTSDPEDFDALFPASQVSIRKEGRRHLTDGLGIALVGWKKTTPVTVKRPAFQPPTGMPHAMNATLRFQKNGEPVWHFVKRWIDDDVALGGTEQVLAADWSAPNVFYWKMTDLDDLTVQNVLLPERFMEETGLYFLQPYDPEKIPVVMVHGLASSPDAFRHIINDLAPEPWFREKYQVWLFNYPTGNPWLYTGIRFREFMNEAADYARSQGHDRNLNRTVILAHSMGGLVARSSVTDPGTTVYDEHFDVPLAQLDVSSGARKLIEAGTLYEPLKEPDRVVFLAVPHGGSPTANIQITRFLSTLIRLPKTLTVDLLDATLRAARDAAATASQTPRMPTSISGLSPKSRGIKALAKMPLPRDIRFHSIIGNRGKTGLADPGDGIVPYTSSKIGPVESEKIVPWGHGVTDCPVASEEVKRILKLHLENP